MFKIVKTKLTFIFTLSLLCLLMIFIGLLYFLISHEINEKEMEDLQSYYQKNKMDFIEDLYDPKDRGIQYEPNQAILYYLFNQKNEFVYGEEAIKSFSHSIKNHLFSTKNSYIKRVVWKNHHFLLLKKPITTNGALHGFVILGIDITSETDLVQTIMWTLFLLTILFSVFYALMGYNFAGQAMKPIKNAFNKQEKFVSDASHELRTPLSIFYSSIDLLERDENLSTEGQEVLREVRAEAELMNNLISSLLFLARSDQNQIPLDMKQVNLSSLLCSVTHKISRTIPENICFEVNIEDHIFMICDEIRIKQLLYILLDNAIRYTLRGKIKLELKTEKDKIIITVQDTGLGISRNDLPFIFDRFYQADFAREKGGSGLGLSIAKAIVSSHNGDIQVDSVLGTGSTFIVIFS